MQLPCKHFKLLYKKVVNNVEYFVVRPKGRPMILFGSGRPKASVRFRCQKNQHQNNKRGNRGRATIAKRTYQSNVKCDFQGLVDRDN